MTRPYNQKAGAAHVYRFGDFVAVSLPYGNRAVYLSASEAMGLSVALRNVALDVTDQKQFSESKLGTEVIRIGGES